MKNIHILPTDKPSKLFKNIHSSLFTIRKHYDEPLNKAIQNQHIYITSDEEIKEGDWYLYDNRIIQANRLIEFHPSVIDLCKKIILTTDQDLIKDGVQAIDDEFLQWFVAHPSCEEVKIEFETLWLNKRFGGTWQPFPDEQATEKKKGYKIIIPKEEPKQESLEEVAHKILVDYGIKSMGQSLGVLEVKKLMVDIAKWQQERSYSEEEVWKLVNKLNETLNIGSDLTLEQWFEQFKKK